MKSGRKYENQLITDINVFEKKWWAWWYEIQPAARQLRGGQGALQGPNSTALKRPSEVQDWKKLHKTGTNGLILVILSLVWWGDTGITAEW